MELGIFTAEDRQRLMEQVSQTGHLSDYAVTLNVRNGPRRTVLQSMRATPPTWAPRSTPPGV